MSIISQVMDESFTGFPPASSMASASTSITSAVPSDVQLVGFDDDGSPYNALFRFGFGVLRWIPTLLLTIITFVTIVLPKWLFMMLGLFSTTLTFTVNFTTLYVGWMSSHNYKSIDSETDCLSWLLFSRPSVG